MLAIARDGTQIGIGVDHADHPDVIAIATHSQLSCLRLDPTLARSYLARGNDLAAIELSILLSSVIGKALADIPHHRLAAPPHQTLTPRDEAIAVASITGQAKCPPPTPALRARITEAFTEHSVEAGRASAPGIKPFVIDGQPRITITSMSVLNPLEHFTDTVISAINTVMATAVSAASAEHPISSPSETAAHTITLQRSNTDHRSPRSAVNTGMERPTP